MKGNPACCGDCEAAMFVCTAQAQTAPSKSSPRNTASTSQTKSINVGD